MDAQRCRRPVLSEATYQGSCALSVLGNSIAAVVLPLLVLKTTGSVLSAGALALATGLPQFLAAVLGGVVADRVDRRAVAVVGDVLSAAAIGALAVVNQTVGLDVGWYMALGVVSAVGDVPALTAREAMVPALAEATGASRQRLIATRDAMSAASTVIGPAVAAALVTFVEPGSALFVTAATSAAAAVMTTFLPPEVGRVPGRQSAKNRREWGADFTEGVGHLLGSAPVLRVATIVGVLFVSLSGAVQAIALPVYFTSVGQPGRTGWTLSVMAVGMMAGAGLFVGAYSRLGSRNTLRVGIADSFLGAALLPGILTFGVMLGAVATLGLGLGIVSAVTGVITLEAADPQMRGRVLGNQNAISFAVAPIVVVVIAGVIELTTVHVALAAVAIVFAAMLAWSLVSRTIPEGRLAAEEGDTVAPMSNHLRLENAKDGRRQSTGVPQKVIME